MDLLLNEQQRMLQSTVQDLLRRDFTKETLVAIDAGTVDVAHGLARARLHRPARQPRAGGARRRWRLVRRRGRPVRGARQGPCARRALLVRRLRGARPAGVRQRGTAGRAHLPAIASGGEVFAVAVTEPEYGWERADVQTTAERTSHGYALTGVKLHVPDAAQATHLLVAARTGGEAVGLYIVPADAPGVACRTLSGLSTGLGEVRLGGVAVGEDALLGGAADGWDAFERAMLKATAVLSAYQVGGLESVFRMCLEYSRTRRQFQQPIGRFQRVQDHVIDIVNHLDAARWTTYEALWKLDTGRPAESGVHMAAALASEGYYLACNAAHDVHAGVGIVREYGLTLHTRMSRTLYHHLGSPRYHRRRLAGALGL